MTLIPNMENEERSHHQPLALYPDLYQTFQKLKISDIVQKSCHDESQRTHAQISYKNGPEYKEIPTLINANTFLLVPCPFSPFV